MHGFEWQNQRGIKGTGFVRALQSLLTSRLLKFQLDAERLVKESLQIAFQDVHSDGKLTVFSSLFSYFISYCLMG